jgi:excisionase family DNA binding protein
VEVLSKSGHGSQTPDESLLNQLVRLLSSLDRRLAQSAVESKDLLDIRTVARRLSCSVKTVENLIRSGYLQSSIMPGTKNARRVSREQLKRYIQLHNDGV